MGTGGMTEAMLSKRTSQPGSVNHKLNRWMRWASGRVIGISNSSAELDSHRLTSLIPRTLLQDLSGQSFSNFVWDSLSVIRHFFSCMHMQCLLRILLMSCRR